MLLVENCQFFLPRMGLKAGWLIPYVDKRGLAAKTVWFLVYMCYTGVL